MKRNDLFSDILFCLLSCQHVLGSQSSGIHRSYKTWAHPHTYMGAHTHTLFSLTSSLLQLSSKANPICRIAGSRRISFFLNFYFYLILLYNFYPQPHAAYNQLSSLTSIPGPKKEKLCILPGARTTPFIYLGMNDLFLEKRSFFYIYVMLLIFLFHFQQTANLS